MRENLRRDPVAGTVRLQTAVSFDDDPNYRRDSIDSGPGDYSVGRAGHIVVEATQPGGQFANNLDLRARIIAPDLSAADRVLQQTAAGLYETDFLADRPGPYIVSVEGADHQVSTTGAVRSYSPEYGIRAEDSDLLVRLSEATGGDVIESGPWAADEHPSDDQTARRPQASQGPAPPRDLFDHAQTNTIPHEIWDKLVLIALLLLPLDVGIRRLSMSREDLRRFRGKVWALIASGIQYARESSRAGNAHAGAAGMARLKASRQRMRLRQPTDENPASARYREGDAPRAGDGGGNLPPAEVQARSGHTADSSASPARAPAPGPEGAPLATRLLDLKRKRQK
jgi:hypothetical protein